jgi:tRNA(Ile)-lysidine synthase
VTAHHQDDALETMCINLIRGTGWRGLAVLGDPSLVRPLLDWSKADIVQYAIDHGLTWRDDATNDSLYYLRNRVRNRIIPALSAAQRQQLTAAWQQQLALAQAIDQESQRYLPQIMDGRRLDRYQITMLPETVAIEVLGVALQRIVGVGLPRPDRWRLLHFVRTAQPHSELQLSHGVVARAAARSITI